MRWIILALALVVTPVYAQQRAPTGPPICILGHFVDGCRQLDGKIWHGDSAAAAVQNENPLAKPFQAIADLLESDSEAAIALATAIPGLQDGNGQACWMSMKAFGDVLKAHPVPLTLKAQTDLESLRLLTMAANKLCANTACTQVFADLTNGLNTAAPVGLPVTLPSLNSLCSKVPQIAVVAPVTVPAPAPTTTPTPAPTTPAAPTPAPQ